MTFTHENLEISNKRKKKTTFFSFSWMFPKKNANIFVKLIDKSLFCIFLIDNRLFLSYIVVIYSYDHQI